MIPYFMQLGLFGGTTSPPPGGDVVPASRTVFLSPIGTSSNTGGTIPPTTFIWPEPMDPYDLLDFKIDCSGLLQTGETIADYALALRPEASLLGLQINNTTPYGITNDGTSIVLWLTIISAEQANTSFIAGALLPIEVSITTSLSPARKRQRTVAVRVVQQ